MKKNFPLNLLRVTPGRAALIIWASGLLLLALCSLWAMREDREAARERLTVQARNTAVQLSALLAVPAWDVDELAARTIVMAAMEDERIYAVKVQTPQGMLEGQRRNYQWEPVPWDDEMAEDAVAGLSPLRVEGRPVGTVQVYVAPRESREETALAARRELWRFVLSGALWTAALAAVFRLRRARRPECVDTAGLPPVTDGAEVPQSEDVPCVPQPVLPEAEDPADALPGAATADTPESGDAESLEPLLPNTAGEIVSPALGLAFMRRHDHVWLVAAGLFRHSFAHAPGLMSRLYEEGDSTALCRLGYLLERAAPCLGAERLAGAAKAMQTALHGPDGLRATLAVEECVRALDEVLDSLR
ncbi:MAG: hypothetical protein DESF_01033 [Desulfovibrio sp.]